MADYVDESRTRMTLQDYARHRGVSRQAVMAAAKRHGIPVDTSRSTYTINADVADRLWAASVTQAPNAGKPGGGAHPTATTPPPLRMAAAGVAMLDAKERKEAALAGLAELRLEQAHGRLVDVAAAAKASAAALRVLRDRVLMVPVRVAAQVAATSDHKQVQALLDQELRVALAAGADALDRMAAEIAAGGLDAEDDEVTP